MLLLGAFLLAVGVGMFVEKAELRWASGLLCITPGLVCVGAVGYEAARWARGRKPR